MIVGYARVSTDGQTLDAQQSALAAAGAERVYAEKISGAVTNRKALAKAIAALGPGDVLLVTRLDRLARSTRDLLNVRAKCWPTLGAATMLVIRLYRGSRPNSVVALKPQEPEFHRLIISRPRGAIINVRV